MREFCHELGRDLGMFLDDTFIHFIEVGFLELQRGFDFSMFVFFEGDIVEESDEEDFFFLLRIPPVNVLDDVKRLVFFFGVLHDYMKLNQLSSIHEMASSCLAMDEGMYK